MSALRHRHGAAALGAAALIAMVAVTLFWYLGYAYDYLHEDGRTVRAEFTAVPQLQPGDPIRVDGRREGEVRRIEDLGGGRGALVTFDVAQDAGPLYRDSVVELRWKSLLGGAFYLEVDRGTPQSGDLAGRTIPRSQTRQQVELDDVTSVFRGRAREGLARTPRELSRALRDPQAVPGLLHAASAASPALEEGLGALRGQNPDVDLRNLITGAAATVSALDAPDDDLRKLVGGAASLAGTAAGRERELRRTLDQGPQVTEDVRTTLARLDTTLAGADTLVGKLGRSADAVRPTLAALRPTLGTTSRLLDRATPLVQRLRPVAASLAALSRTGLPLLDGLQPSLDRLDEKILPYLARKDPGTGIPTSTMIGGLAAGFGGSAGQQDANGHFIRLPFGVGTDSVYLPCKTAITDPTVGQTLACASLQTALNTYLQYVPRLTPQPRSTK